ncbi:hypothetical protein TRL7639_02767 [Falsiruegeria litorea R37]|uniref:Uncharacterized protein n=1 Tax=Falsiruegeria litorea R37 TaxID=1200284 RepID=A0A1Y5SZV3_9RHOB|nr:hypothetical protein TRL7639_02767 [Falsiruegeria litorea R37]
MTAPFGQLIAQGRQSRVTPGQRHRRIATMCYAELTYCFLRIAKVPKYPVGHSSNPDAVSRVTGVKT